MNDRLNRTVERLLLDRRFLRRFRRDPEAALRPYALTHEEIEAVKAGDAAVLIDLGLDPSYVRPKVSSPGLRTWVLRHAKKLAPAVVLAALALPATPALAAPDGRARGSRVGRVTRFFGRRGVAGEFHAQLARTRRAGRLTSRAATGRNAAAFVARARRSAREFGIQPPPGGENQ
jgi:Aromatic-ring-opening dioxygenase LigAB, LigA subunit